MPAPVLDLDAIAPPDRKLVFRGETYWLPGDVPMETVIAGVRLEADLRAAEAADDPDEQARILQSMYDVAMDLIRDRRPDCPALRLSTTEVSRIIAFASSGLPDEESPEQAALGALLGDEAAEGGGVPPTVAESAPKKPKGSRSARRSLSASSG